MQIHPPCVAALRWTLTDTTGDVLDVLDTPIEFFIGGTDLLDAIEAALRGHCAGSTLHLHLEPEDAFGDYEAQRVHIAPRSLFPAVLDEGMMFDATALPPACKAKLPDDQADLVYTVTELYPEHIVLDGNHPLAGMALRLQLHVSSVRDAEAAELERRSTGVGGFFRIGS
ncbi:FKBP-type peptidyl-prolyl cis-trans isomerase [Candidatus Symbiobacter mobilis]|nr:FKBP-type peptidyl-prolyl cis-trans isomerase [Candidatus Symbiobacter mobilis]